MSLNINKDFFLGDAEAVAKGLLGMTLARNVDSKILKARIVETEAYYGKRDPASRARQNGDLRQTMLMGPGTILVYGVHNNWLINFVNNKEGIAQAVLLRALEPLNFESKCNGPGLLTKGMKIDKSFHKQNILNNKEIWLEDSKKGNKDFEIKNSFRIGVVKDLPRKLRFYIKDNLCVSRK